MSYTSRSIRFEDDPEGLMFTRSKENVSKKHKNKIHDVGELPEANLNKVEKQVEMTMTSSSLKAKVLSRVFSEDYERVKNKILDPQGETIRRWNKIFLVSCLVSLFIDPLFFYLPEAGKDMCMAIGIPLEVTLMVIRSVADMFYIIQIYVRFRTAFVAPSSRVFGRGELVIDASRIASRYLAKDFWIDLVAAIPFPQMLIWVVVPFLDGSLTTNTKNVLWFTIMIQYLPRLFLIFPLSSKIVNTTGVVTETAWAGAAYNLMLYMLASHVLGACWYLLSIERQEACLRKACKLERSTCRHGFLDCHNEAGDSRKTWFASSNITKLCDPDNNDFFKFGIYGDALTFDVTSTSFFNKYFYCFWWGLRNLSSLGTNLSTSTFVGEISFAIVIAIVGLVLFARLIGNMQTYLQSTTVRLEEWRIKRTDTEQWMRHRQLPQELKDNVRRYDHYKWLATRGVDEERLLKDLPLDLRRDIKRHLCLDLVRRVPLFDQMDEQMLDAICERLKPALCTQGTCLVREGDPVNEMLFIIRGHLDSYTTNGGRTGFFNLSCIGPGDFCGEELLTWALDPRPNVILPSSTRTVRAISEVEAFALIAEDMKFVAGQFRRLHSKQLRHKFRFYSHQWRTWAACFIQAAWRRFKRRRVSLELKASECVMSPDPTLDYKTRYVVVQHKYAKKAAASTRIGGGMPYVPDSDDVSPLQKPAEPDFS